MILSASRRTDIPAFYAEWFMNRLREGCVLVRNPMNYHQVSRVRLDSQVTDCAVFWTKNPAPLLEHLDEIERKFPFYFQYTLNPYGRDIEPALPDIDKRIETFRTLSEKLGAHRVVRRYDPILLTEKYTVDWHIERFEYLAEQLRGCQETCVFSFVDIYDKVKNNVKGTGLRACDEAEMQTLAEAFARIARENGFELRTCAETIDLDALGIKHGCCVDGQLIERLTGCELTAKKDPNQRGECGCLESVDIGQYNTCRHGCRYCYANFNPQSVKTFSERHDPASPFLTGGSEPGDKVTERKLKSLKGKPKGIEQISMW